MKNVKCAIILIIILLPSSCQSINTMIQDPKVSLNSVELKEITFNGVDLVARVDVENPNGFSIPLPKISWELSINEESFVQGLVENKQSIRSRRKLTLDLPLNISYAGLYRAFSSLIDEDEAAYNLGLQITFPLPAIEDKVFNLGFSGQLPLLQLPNIKSASVDVSKMDYSGIVLACLVNVENPNRFAIPFPEMDCDYSVNGLSVLKSSNVRTGEIAAGVTALTNFNLSVNYADIFRIVNSAKNVNEADGRLSLAAVLPISAFDGKKSSLDIPGKLPILHKPELSFQGIVRRSLGTTMEFTLNWEMENKNSFSYDVENFICDFSVNDNLWAQGRVNNVPQIKAGAKTIIPLNVSISTPSIVRELVDVINRGSSVNYNCTGSLGLLSDLPGLDIPELILDLQGNTRIR